jgi:hypothetical protein
MGFIRILVTASDECQMIKNLNSKEYDPFNSFDAKLNDEDYFNSQAEEDEWIMKDLAGVNLSCLLKDATKL